MDAELAQVKRGLSGVIADTTAISMVNQETNSLLYRGYPVQDLAAQCTFEEVAYLIWHSELPSHDQLRQLTDEERSRRSVDARLLDYLRSIPISSHPMDILRTAISFIGASYEDTRNDEVAGNFAKSIDMIAKIPTIVAFEQRRKRGQDPIPPDRSLGFAENFFYMCFGEVPSREVLQCFEISLILYAEHSFNASTFTARVIASTLSDIHSAVVGAIGALKGPLHGGANEAVMYMMDEIGTPARAEAWLKQALAEKRKIMGFGHAVYKHGDSRVPTMRNALTKLAKLRDGEQLFEMYEIVAETMLEQKNIYPNLDFPSGPAYNLMGFDTPTFTPIFVMSRITGWTAHVMEQLSENVLIRPLSTYVGFPERRL